MNNPTSRAVVR